MSAGYPFETSGQDHRIRFATVDLTASPTEIRHRLLVVTEPPIRAPSARPAEAI